MSSAALFGCGEGRLGFARLAQRAFDFLLPLGFEVVRKEGTFLRFESPTVFVNVYHGRFSYQVGLELGRVESGEMYSLHELLAAIAPGEVKRARCQTTDSRVLDRCLSAIAEIVDRECRPLLAGDASAFDSLRAAIAPARTAVTLKAQFGALLDRADRAWEAKDFREALDLYRKAEPALDQARRRRLQYMSKRTEEPTND